MAGTDLHLGHETLGEPPEFVVAATDMPELGERRQGKVRDIYERADEIFLVATDRYSAFDRNLALVPHKGELVSRTSRFWFDQTRGIINNHVLDYPDPNVTVATKCKVLPIEMVVRGYMTGVTNTSLWNRYKSGDRKFGELVLPADMRKNEPLPRPLLDPTTKSDIHDQPLTLDQIVDENIVDADTLYLAAATALKLFSFGQQLASERGFILVDTKYEFGLTEENELILIDELHTPDSSRYWDMRTYEQRLARGNEPDNYDKEYLRLWFKERFDPYRDAAAPEVPTEVVHELSRRYQYLYEQLTGETFVPDTLTPPVERIRKNMQNYLSQS